MESEGGAQDADALLDAVGTAFSWLRRRTPQVYVDPPVSRKDLPRNLVINVVEEADGEATVGAVAETLAVDLSIASRMVSDCVSNGYLERVASQRDGRRTVLRITPEGLALRDSFCRQQRRAFEHITRGWPEHERVEFARLLLKYADAADELTTGRHP